MGAGRGFSALNTGLQPPSGPLIATVEVHSEPPADDAFPDPLSWKETGTVAPNEKQAAEDGQTASDIGDRGRKSTTGSDSPKTAETKENVANTSAPEVSGGYRSGKWLWEWRIVSCGNRTSVGVCGQDVAVVSAAGVPLQSGSGGGGGGGSEGGSDSGNSRPDLWLYRSDGHLSHGGESTERVCPAGGFESEDVIGVELDADAGTVAFLKNDSYVGAQFKIVELSKLVESGGLYPCISLRGSGDAAVLLGLKEGPGSITYRPPAKGGVSGGGDKKDSSNAAAAPRGGEGLAAALTAAVAAATAAAEAVAASAAATVGGGDVAALEAAEAAVASERAADGRNTSPEEKSEVEGTAEESTATGMAGSEQAEDNGGAAATCVTGSGTGGSPPTANAAAATPSTSEAAKVTPRPPPPPPPLPGTAPASYYPSSFHGEFLRGLKHGPGVLRLSGKGGYWKGKWFQGVQHGVHLLVEHSGKKSHVEELEDGTPTAWVFDRGTKVRYRILEVLVFELVFVFSGEGVSCVSIAKNRKS